MNKSRPKLLKPSMAAAIVAAASVSLQGLALGEYIASLNIKPHGTKDRNSGRGSKSHKISGYRFLEPGPLSQEREMARRRRQIEKGMIPMSLVHPA